MYLARFGSDPVCELLLYLIRNFVDIWPSIRLVFGSSISSTEYLFDQLFSHDCGRRSRRRRSFGRIFQTSGRQERAKRTTVVGVLEACLPENYLNLRPACCVINAYYSVITK